MSLIMKYSSHWVSQWGIPNGYPNWVSQWLTSLLHSIIIIQLTINETYLNIYPIISSNHQYSIYNLHNFSYLSHFFPKRRFVATTSRVPRPGWLPRVGEPGHWDAPTVRSFRNEPGAGAPERMWGIPKSPWAWILLVNINNMLLKWANLQVTMIVSKLAWSSMTTEWFGVPPF